MNRVILILLLLLHTTFGLFCGKGEYYEIDASTGVEECFQCPYHTDYYVILTDTHPTGSTQSYCINEATYDPAACKKNVHTTLSAQVS